MSSQTVEDALVLRTFRSHSGQPENATSATSASGRSLEETETPPTEQASRTYQCLLVFAGFMMTFHVIGINSIYGLFQVRRRLLVAQL